MGVNKISVSEAIVLIKNNKFRKSSIVEFTSNKINVFDAILIGKSGVDIPDELIEYDDENINYSDIPAITDEDVLRHCYEIT